MVKEYTYLVTYNFRSTYWDESRQAQQIYKIENKYYEDEEFLEIIKNRIEEEAPGCHYEILNIINLTKIKPIMEE